MVLPHFSLPPPAALILLAVAYGAADRAIGAGVKASRWAGPLILMALGFAVSGPVGAFLSLLWAIYRVLPFSGGAAAPETSGQRLAALARHLPALLGVAVVFWQCHVWILPVAAFGLYVAAATGLACWYGIITLAHKAHGEPGGEENAIVEALRGALFGAAVWTATTPVLQS